MQVLEDTSNDQIGSFSVHLRSRADLSGVQSFSPRAHGERGWFVYNALKRQASMTQRPIVELLKQRTDVVRITPYFVSNFIIVEGKRSIVDLLAKVRVYAVLFLIAKVFWCRILFSYLCLIVIMIVSDCLEVWSWMNAR